MILIFAFSSLHYAVKYTVQYILGGAKKTSRTFAGVTQQCY